jgi:signal transduction histidine kinase
MSALVSFFRSMAGRIFLLLVVGIAISTMLATVLADARRLAELEHIHLELTADRLQDYVANIGDLHSPTRWPGGVVELDEAPAGAQAGPIDQALTTLLETRLGKGYKVQAFVAPLKSCALVSPLSKRASVTMTQPRCWLVTFNLGTVVVRLAVDWPTRASVVTHTVDPLFLAVLTLAAAGMAFAVSRMAAAPVNRLADAATRLGRDLDEPPLAETGPSEVAAAARAFNTMQAQLKLDLVQRRQMLAAITHDLRTPLTRLRLRLERVADQALRDRLVADLAAMNQLIQEGLDLARTAEHTEPEAVLNLDSLLLALAEDEADTGGKVKFMSGCGCHVRVRPLALRRAITNLIDNALRHAGDAELSSARRGDFVTIVVRDRGPGIDEALLEKVFEPFFRLEESRSRDTGGVGLGLTVARTLVEQCHGELTLRAPPGGGLEAVVLLRAAQD